MRVALKAALKAALKIVRAAGTAVLLLLPQNAQAEIPVSIELVLAVDISRSVDDVEYDLQVTGIARAFRDPVIIDLIGQHNGVAVTLFRWDTDIDKRHMIPWHLLREPAGVLSFADKVAALERGSNRRFTGIGKAIDFGVYLIAANEFSGRLLKIDISGDGRDNIGSLTPATRQRAGALRIAINRFPILIATFNLGTYYREKGLLGPALFL